MTPQPVDIEILKRLKECLPQARVETDMTWDRYFELNYDRIMNKEQ